MSGPVAGAYAEHDARVGITATGANVTAWADQSGSGLTLNTVDGTTPKTGVRAINGQNAILFNTALIYTTSAVASPRTIIGVVQSDITTVAGTARWYQSDGVANAGITGSSWYFNANTNLTGGTPDLNPHVISLVFNGATSSMYVDGVLTASGTCNTLTTVYHVLGGDGGTGPWNGLIGHVFGYPSALSDADRILVENYLKTQWLVGPQAPITVIRPSFWTPQGFNRQLGTPLSLRGGSAATALTTNQMLSVTSTQTPTLTKSTSKTLSVTETQTATLSRIVAYLRTLSVTSTQTPTILRSISKTLSVTSNQTATMTRSVGKTISVVSTQTASLTRAVAYQRTLSVTSTALATLFKSISKTLSTTSTQTASMVEGQAFLRTLDVTSTQTADLTVEFLPVSKGGIRPGQQFIESPDYLRDQRRREELERRNDEALALLLLTS